MKLYELADKYLKKESYMRSKKYIELLKDYQEALGNEFNSLYKAHLSLNAIIAQQAFIDGFKLSKKNDGDVTHLKKLRNKYITREMYKSPEGFDEYNDLYYMELQQATKGETIVLYLTVMEEISDLRKVMDKEVAKIAFTDGWGACLNYLKKKEENLEKESQKEKITISRETLEIKKEIQEENCKREEVSEIEKAIKKRLKKAKINYEYLNIIYKGTVAFVYLDSVCFGMWDILQNDMVGFMPDLKVEEWKEFI